MFNLGVKRAFSTSTRLCDKKKNYINYSFNHDTKVGTISLNDPEHRNALNEPMGRELTKLLKKEIAKKRPSDLRAVILTGEGSTFSVGGNLSWLHERHHDKPHNNTIICRDFHQRFLNLRALCPVPIITAINGSATGTGFALACSTDIRVTKPDVKMGVNFVGIGLSPGMGATHLLPSMVGPQLAAEMLLTGDLITGTEAVDRGFCLRAVDDPLEEANAIAAKIAAMAPLAVRGTILALRKSQDAYGMTLADTQKKEVETQSACYRTLDLKEGLDALKEHRSPQFQGE